MEFNKRDKLCKQAMSKTENANIGQRNKNFGFYLLHQ